MVMRQRQERENIKSKIRAVEKEGANVMDDLKRVSYCMKGFCSDTYKLISNLLGTVHYLYLRLELKKNIYFRKLQQNSTK